VRLSGKEIAEKIYVDLRKRVGELQKKNITPHLVVFLIGANPASVAYVKQKQKKGEEIGCKVTVLNFSETVTTEELEEKVKLLNDDPFVHGILIQRPVPHHVAIEKLETLTNPQKDIDGFHPDSPYTLPLPLAVVKILEEVYNFETNTGGTGGKETGTGPVSKWLQTKNIIVTGKGPTGGGPIIAYLKTLNVTSKVIDSKTPHPKELLKQADIVIAAVGKENILKPNDLKKGVILIGVGILRGEDGKLAGDYDENDVENVASYYTPTPGGVGPVNVAMLIDNLLTATEKQTKAK
jgi:methylenetetrahydrofolate dehydrogenase (NADP+)/methenyltetrahydrofolate cyclohydrolase